MDYDTRKKDGADDTKRLQGDLAAKKEMLRKLDQRRARLVFDERGVTSAEDKMTATVAEWEKKLKKIDEDIRALEDNISAKKKEKERTNNEIKLAQKEMVGTLAKKEEIEEERVKIEDEIRILEAEIKKIESELRR